MESLYEYLYMNGYSFYIWTSYSIWFFLMFLLIIKVTIRKKTIEKKISTLKKRK